MCIVLSSAARASLATAVFGAVLSNFLGTFIAPATIFWSVGAAAVNVPYLDVVRKLVYKVSRVCGVEILIMIAYRHGTQDTFQTHAPLIHTHVHTYT
jgi:hypothetical protein